MLFIKYFWAKWLNEIDDKRCYSRRIKNNYLSLKYVHPLLNTLHCIAIVHRKLCLYLNSNNISSTANFDIEAIISQKIF